MTGTYPQAEPTTLIVCTAVTPHRHVETDDAIDSVTVNPVDITMTLRAAQEREGRVMEQPPAHPQRNYPQRTQDQRITDGIGKGDPRQKIRNYPAQVPGAVLRGCGESIEPRAEQSADT